MIRPQEHHNVGNVPGNGSASSSRRRRGRPSRRAEIVDAAATLFAKGGFAGTSLAAIAERIGMTAPAITHHFGSKEALLREVVESTDRFHDVLMVATESANGLERLSATRRWPRLLEEDDSLANLSRLSTIMAAEALDPDSPVHDEFVERHRRFRRLVAELVEGGVNDGSIRQDADADAIATQVVAFAQGAQLSWYLDPDEVDLVAAYDGYFDGLVERLAASSRSVSESSR